MALLKWGPDVHTTPGVDRGVLYPRDGEAQTWNGLISIDEVQDDASTIPRYLDGVRVGTTIREGSYSASVEAFTYPDILEAHGLMTSRPKYFGLSWRTQTSVGYQLHLVYMALFSPIQKTYGVLEASTFSWDLTTRGVPLEDGTRVAHLLIDSASVLPESIALIESLLYGDDSADARMPSISEILAAFAASSELVITVHEDGTWTAAGPSSIVKLFDDGSFEIDYSTVVYQTPDTYTVHSTKED